MMFVDLKAGQSVEGEKIQSLRSEFKASKYIYLIAGTHGDEVEGVYLLKQIMQWLENSEELELPVVSVPILNVDGYRASTRVNSSGVDLNRNYPTDHWSDQSQVKKHNPGPKPLSEPENKYLVKLFQKFPPGIIISFHSWKPMLNYNGDCQDIAQFLNKYNNYEIVAEFTDHPTPGSLGELAPNKYSSPVLTFECPLLETGISLKEIWKENEDGLKALFNSELLKRFIS